MRSSLMAAVAAIAVPMTTAALAASPLEVTSRMLGQTRVAAADGTVAIRRMPAKRVVPGDTVTFVLAYRNTGTKPIADLVLANPVPATVTYRGVTDGTPEPEVSVDGHRFAALSSLRIATRPATAGDVVAVRWRVAALPAGGTGTLAFDAIVR